MVKKWGVLLLILLLSLTSCRKTVQDISADSKLEETTYEELSFESLLPKGEVVEIYISPDHFGTSFNDTKIIKQIIEKWNDVILKDVKVTKLSDEFIGAFYDVHIILKDENSDGKGKSIGFTYVSGGTNGMEIIYYDTEDNRYKLESAWSKSFSDLYHECQKVCPSDIENGRW